MNKYRQLVFNTLIFGISTFSSKLLVFFLMPLYTRVLTTTEYGVVDLIVQTANLLLPIVSLTMGSAVIRFALDKKYSKQAVFTVGVNVLLLGFLVLLIASPLLMLLEMIRGYEPLVVIYVMTACGRTLCTQFVRGRKLVRLFAFDGVMSTVTTIIFNVLFLVVFKMGITGYVLATITADFISIVFLFIAGGLRRYYKPRQRLRTLYKEMLKYSIPLIPTKVSWWFTNVSDRYLVTYFVSAAANGLYAIGNRVPSVVILVSTIFIDSWQLSAVGEKDGAERDKFFSNVFNSYSAIVFIIAAGLIASSKIITRILVSESFYASWEYIPILVLATSLSCLVTFLGSVYTVHKKSMRTLYTSMLGSLSNIAINIMLIPLWGVQGAALATVISYLLVFITRIIDTRKFIKIKVNFIKFIPMSALLVAETVIMLSEIKYSEVYAFTIAGVIAAVNFKEIISMANKLLKRGNNG